MGICSLWRVEKSPRFRIDFGPSHMGINGFLTLRCAAVCTILRCVIAVAHFLYPPRELVGTLGFATTAREWALIHPAAGSVIKAHTGHRILGAPTERDVPVMGSPAAATPGRTPVLPVYYL